MLLRNLKTKNTIHEASNEQHVKQGLYIPNREGSIRNSSAFDRDVS